VAILTGGLRWLASVIENKDIARAIVLLIGAAVALVVTLAYQHVPQEIAESWLQTWAVAIGGYEVVYKTILKPSLEKAGLL